MSLTFTDQRPETTTTRWRLIDRCFSPSSLIPLWILDIFANFFVRIHRPLRDDIVHFHHFVPLHGKQREKALFQYINNNRRRRPVYRFFILSIVDVDFFVDATTNDVNEENEKYETFYYGQL